MNNRNKLLTTSILTKKHHQIMDKTEESFLNFDDGISSRYTRRAYHRAINRFMELHGMGSFDIVTKLPQEEISSLVKQFIRHLKEQDLATNTVKLNLVGVLLFFDMNDILLNKKKLYKMVKPNDEESQKRKSVLAGKKPYTDDDIRKLLGATKKLRTKAIIHFFTSTGARPAVIWDPILRMKHLFKMPQGCKALNLYSESDEEYWSFLTPEAAKALQDYHDLRKDSGEIFDDETPVFAIRKGKPMSEYSVRAVIKDTIKQAGIAKTKINNKTDKASFYGFRKRFNTILKSNNNVNSNIAEKLMAHKNGLDGVYLQPTKEECFAEFVKSAPQLMIDQTEIQQHKIQELEKQNDHEISKLRNEIQILKEIIEEQEIPKEEWEEIKKNSPKLSLK
ncbi:integrase family protein [Marine Group I thaumarchaeote SCGC AAA799-P11]|uniref:Integrase family protein n=1 Tax=Marine Group I thaumarchaeote SCGC AAA799-P11 TaxID=1502295 RepID=A0A087RZA8_9ARCH|nr:integrase family protein [Marine Group I thaumarchaeote SCGC AAA799-P11]